MWSLHGDRFKRIPSFYLTRYGRNIINTPDDLISLVGASNNRNVAITLSDEKVGWAASNLATDRAMRRSFEFSSKDLPGEPDMLAGPAPTHDECARPEKLLEVLDHALAALPSMTVEIFNKRGFEGWSTAQIAFHLGLMLRTVQKHVANVLVYLQHRLERFLPEDEL